MKIEEVIKQLESIADHTRSMAASPDADEIWKEDSDALEFALTALRSMQETGAPIDSPPAHIDRSKWELCDNCKKDCWNCKHNFFCCEGNDKECDDCVNQSKWEHSGYQQYCSKCGRPLTEEAWAELERRIVGDCKCQTIGVKIKNARIKKAMSKYKLAKLLNVSASTISNWESGKTIPRGDSLIKISSMLGISANEILRDQED